MNDEARRDRPNTARRHPLDAPFRIDKRRINAESMAILPRVEARSTWSDQNMEPLCVFG